ncbi:BRCA2-interacting transcriptional repressor EMSY-like isoform X4 [Scylla paramamosain]|uniref:BRCA2-interacting transcriptional repressor EMSY-like isoform X4 n=1 Tax=Scylla paramamosain TaxID=85552 RepID=UPI003083E6F3
MKQSSMEVGYKLPNKWPKLLDMTKDECRKALRALELTTYSQVVSVLRAQGELTKEKKKLLSDLQTMFSISLERHRAEIRRAVNDEKLTTIADTLAGPNTGVEWAVEGRRLVPLMPRVPPQTAYTALATRMALLYYGMNAKMPHPSATAHYGKMDDLGAESGDTDSEEETEGLRFMPGAMVPPQYNADQGSYTTLPFSQARLSKLPPKENREIPTTTSGGSGGSAGVGGGGGAGGGTATSGGTGGGGSDKRKRKRSSSEHPLPPPPPPPPPPPTPPTPPTRDLPSSPGTPNKVTGIGRPLPGPPMKITVTGNITRGTSGTPVSTLGSHTQKVILVSTSGASGVGGGVYQRSLSVPVMKGGTGTAPTVMRGVSASSSTTPSSQIQTGSTVGSGNMIVPPTYSSSGLHGASAMSPAGTYANRTRPRVPSGTLPSRPRERSKSLVLQADSAGRGAEGSGSSSCSNVSSGSHVSPMPSFPGGSSAVVGAASGSPSLSSGHLMTHQTIQVRPSATINPGKTAIQIRQEGGAGAKIITHAVGSAGVTGTAGCTTSVACTTSTTIITTATSSGITPGSSTTGRLVGRAPILPPSSPQGSGAPLYVVTTNSGTITVVTRTVAAGQGTGPRVVTVNTINAPKSSVSSVRTPTPATVVSVGPKTIQTVRVTPQGQGPSGLRPVLGGTKSNVIVVHKGGPTTGTRPMSIQGIRVIKDVPTKITIGKTFTGSTAAPVLQKPPTVPRGPITTPVLTTASTPTTQSNVIVVDLSPETSNVNNTGALADILQVTGEAPSTSSSGSSSSSNSSSSSSGNSNTSDLTTTTTSMSSIPDTTTIPAASTSITTPTIITTTTSTAAATTSSTSTTITTVSATTTTAASTTSSSVSASTTTATTVALSATPIVSSSDGGAGLSSSGGGSTGGGSGGGGGGGGEGEGEWLNLGLEGEDSPGHSLPEGQMQMLEEAVEILGRGDKESARNLLRQAGIELLDSPVELGEHGAEGTSMASLMAGLVSQLPGTHLDEGPLAPVGELDPVTGLFYNPSSSESLSDSNSNSASDELEVPEERESAD